MKRVVVCEHDPAWAAQFEQLWERIWPHVRDVALSIEHVGSTAVPGVAAKPVIDIDVLIASAAQLPEIVRRLAGLGYQHRGNQGIEGRDAFRAPADGAVAHHLYVCEAGCLALRNHFLQRDHLRRHPEDAAAYGALKRRLAVQFPTDMERYTAGKTSVIVEILRRNGWGIEESASIEAANRVDAATGPADSGSAENSQHDGTS